MAGRTYRVMYHVGGALNLEDSLTISSVTSQ